MQIVLMELNVIIQIVVQLKLLWEKIKNSIDNVMNSITLQDIVDDYEAIRIRKVALKLRRSE